MTVPVIQPGPRLISGDDVNAAIKALNTAAVNAGASLSLSSSANKNNTICLNNAAGSVVTLPTATGSGDVYNFVVTTTVTSNAHKILTNGTDKLIGRAFLQKSNTTFNGFQAQAASGYHSLQMPAAGSTPSGGNEGDSIYIQDIGAGLWCIAMEGTAAGTVGTPFSTATS